MIFIISKSTYISKRIGDLLCFIAEEKNLNRYRILNKNCNRNIFTGYPKRHQLIVIDEVILSNRIIEDCINRDISICDLDSKEFFKHFKMMQFDAEKRRMVRLILSMKSNSHMGNRTIFEVFGTSMPRLTDMECRSLAKQYPFSYAIIRDLFDNSRRIYR